MEVRIIDKKYNPLLKRTEVVFKVEHEKLRGTPQRFVMRAKLAELLKTKLEQVYIRKMETKTGTMIALGEANAYDTGEQAMLVEPKYVIERNTSKETATEVETPKEAKKAEGQKKLENPLDKPVKETEAAESALEARPPKEGGSN